MTTLQESAEELEKLQQDAAAFRYILSHPMSGAGIIEEARMEFDSSREFESAVRKRFRERIAKAPRYLKG